MPKWFQHWGLNREVWFQPIHVAIAMSKNTVLLDKKFYSPLFGKTNKMPSSNLQWTNIQSKTSRCGNTLNGFMVQKSQLCVAHLAE